MNIQDKNIALLDIIYSCRMDDDNEIANKAKEEFKEINKDLTIYRATADKIINECEKLIYHSKNMPLNSIEEILRKIELKKLLDKKIGMLTEAWYLEPEDMFFHLEYKITFEEIKTLEEGSERYARIATA